MTSRQPRLSPTRFDDGRALWGALELGPRSGLECAQEVGTKVGQSAALEPGPQQFDRIQVRRVRWQEGRLKVACGGVQVLAHELAVVRFEVVSDDQQGLLGVGTQGLERKQWDGRPHP